MNVRTEVALVVLTDRLGRILMQHRTADASTDPDLWALPGGAIEAGEGPVDGARRELLEETGLRCPGLTLDRTLVHAFDDGRPTRYHVFSATTEASDDDIVLGEGQAMVFLAAEQIRQRELAPVARTILRALGAA